MNNNINVNEKNKIFDIVILVGPNDEEIIKNQINFTKKNIIGYRNIYFIPANDNFNLDNYPIYSESKFPFSKETIIEIHNIEDKRRIGWYLQQLIKLYAGFIIPDILDNYLIIDADTFFLKPTNFFYNDIALFCTSREYNKEYFLHMKKMNPNLTKIHKKSGIVHHMMFNKIYLKELFNMVEEYQKEKFYIVFLKCVDPKNYLTDGASEYEIYFNFLLKYHPDKIRIRTLKWSNKYCLKDKYFYLLDFVSLHHYARKK